MRSPVKSWTPEETELAETLVRQKATNEMFLAILGRTKACAESKLRRHNDHLFGNIMKTGHYAGEARITIPPQVLEDRNRRLMARKSLTGMLMGDPEPNRQRL